MESANCNLCGSDAAKEFLHVEDLTYGTPGQFVIVKCATCGLTYLSPRPTLEEIGDCYPANCAEHNAGNEPKHFQRAEAEIVRKHGPEGGGAVLDVGCAAGYFLRAMHDIGWAVSGVEPDPSAAAIAAGVPNAKIKVGMLESGDFSSQSFDAVTLWSVIEHLHDPVGVLSTVRDLLKPSGYLHLGLPNFGSLERRLFGAKWFGLDIPRHLYHFTPATIRSALSKAGFRVAELRHASGHDTFRFSIRPDLRRQYGRRPNDQPVQQAVAPVSSQSPFRSRLKRAAVHSFTRFADNIGCGAQMLIVAQPN